MKEIQLHSALSLKWFFLSSDLVIILRRKVQDSVNLLLPLPGSILSLYIAAIFSVTVIYLDCYQGISDSLPGCFLTGNPLMTFVCAPPRRFMRCLHFHREQRETSVFPRQCGPEHQREFGDVSLDVRRWRIANAAQAPFVSAWKRKVNSWCSQDAVGCQEVSTGKKTGSVRSHLVPSQMFSHKVVTWHESWKSYKDMKSRCDSDLPSLCVFNTVLF